MRSEPPNSAPVFLPELWFKPLPKVTPISPKFWRRVWFHLFSRRCQIGCLMLPIIQPIIYQTLDTHTTPQKVT